MKYFQFKKGNISYQDWAQGRPRSYSSFSQLNSSCCPSGILILSLSQVSKYLLRPTYLRLQNNKMRVQLGSLCLAKFLFSVLEGINIITRIMN